MLGYSLNNEAYHMTTPLPGGEAVIACMGEALAERRLEPEPIDYINAHASGTQLNDANECARDQVPSSASTPRAWRSAAPRHSPRIRSARPAPWRPRFARSRWSEGYIPPTLHHRTHDPACDLDIVPNTGRAQPLRYAMNNAFGFGGINSCVVLGRVAE